MSRGGQSRTKLFKERAAKERKEQKLAKRHARRRKPTTEVANDSAL